MYNRSFAHQMNSTFSDGKATIKIKNLLDERGPTSLWLIVVSPPWLSDLLSSEWWWKRKLKYHKKSNALPYLHIKLLKCWFRSFRFFSFSFVFFSVPLVFHLAILSFLLIWFCRYLHHRMPLWTFIEYLLQTVYLALENIFPHLLHF